MVELIVVVAIIAALAAILIPTLIQSVENSRSTACIADCRHFIDGARLAINERYFNKTLSEVTDGSDIASQTLITECFDHAKLMHDGSVPKGYFAHIDITTDGSIKKVVFTDGYYTATYENGSFTTTKDTTISSFVVNIV